MLLDAILLLFFFHFSLSCSSRFYIYFYLELSFFAIYLVLCLSCHIFFATLSFFQIDNIELVVASLENAMTITGGFCCGKKFIIDHQACTCFFYLNF